uniref:Uncharacterized protein n=1 Tax=Chrysotila carterae TaxID=13221 RepID=A0A7S4C4I7_CHRCT|mmetsp:Transcript_13912/g.29931  ORF Transcript_13912/g.29931 Transcript_13912/m.29931 type:complete len:568 (-) Transcript_13912:19-1722(-)
MQEMGWRATVPCLTTDDCAGREVCSVHALCGCGFTDGFANPPACDQFTSATTVVVCANLLEAFFASIAMVAAAALLTKTVQVHPRGFFLSCSILCTLAAATGLAANISYLIYMCTAGDVWPNDQLVQDRIKVVMLAVHATFFICATLNLGLMWLEFVIAARRVEHIASNLRRTASFLYLLTGLWLVASCVLLMLTLRYDYHFFAFWGLLTTIAGVICTVVYVGGGRAMCDVFDRATHSALTNASALMVETPSFSAAELRKAHRMQLRSRTTRRSYYISGCCGAVYVVSSIVWAVLYAYELSHTFLWLFDCILRCSVYTSLISMCFWLHVCVRAEESASFSHSESENMPSFAKKLIPGVRTKRKAPAQSVFATAKAPVQTLPLRGAEQSTRQVELSTQSEQRLPHTEQFPSAQPTKPTDSRHPRQIELQEKSAHSAQLSQQASPVLQGQRSYLSREPQPTEAAPLSPSAEPPLSAPSHARSPSHSLRSEDGTVGAIAPPSQVDEYGAIALPRSARSDPVLAEDGARVCSSTGLVSYAPADNGRPQSTPSDAELEGRRPLTRRIDIYSA